MGRRLAALCALVLSGAVAACAAVTGLDGYSKGDCSGGGDCDASAGDSSVVPDAHPTPDSTADTGSSSGDDATGDAADETSSGNDAAGDATDAARDAKPEAASDAATDGASDASDASDAHPGDGAPDGCGPTNTATNCGACGVACSTTNAQSESCGMTDAGTATCSYVCDPGFANCNTTPPNTGGCSTPTNTVNNCGGCGVACKLTSASADSCNGVTCAYTCIANHSDCNYATAPDTDGCECATPGCCSGACQTTHSDGVGQSFYDCNATKTYTVVTAMEACTAYALSVGGTAANCSDGWSCSTPPKPPYQVCYGDTAGTTCQNYCWGYTGSQGGVLYTCACPVVSAGSWN